MLASLVFPILGFARPPAGGWLLGFFALTVSVFLTACSSGRSDREPLGTDRSPSAATTDSAADTTSPAFAADVYSQIQNRQGRLKVAITARNTAEARPLAIELGRLFEDIGRRTDVLDPAAATRLRSIAAELESAAKRLEAAAAAERYDEALREYAQLERGVEELGRIPFQPRPAS